MKRALIIAFVVGLVIALWARGTFDHALSGIGLNAHECARNGFGATFCGKELTEYRERIERGKQEGEAAANKIREEAARTQAELSAREGQIKREGEEAQERLKAQSEGAP